MHLQLSADPLPAYAPSQAIIGECPAMLAAVNTLARVARSSASVLVSGEVGTGKELFARALHRSSARAQNPFVVVDGAACAGPSGSLEVFGPDSQALGGEPRRAGRIARARGGTLFLDEVGAMSPAVQSRLLRVLDPGSPERDAAESPRGADLRVVAATTLDLEAEVEAGRFHEDLYRRLAVVAIHLPPLRERGDDIRLLAEHSLSQSVFTHGGPARAIARETLSLLLAHPWPGNVRQLRHAIESAVVLAEGPVLLPASLPADVRSPLDGFGRAAADERKGRVELPAAPDAGALAAGVAIAPAADGLLPLEELERRHIAQALALTRGHLARAAELLGIHRNTLRRKLQEHGQPYDAEERAAPRAADPLALPLGDALRMPREVS